MKLHISEIYGMPKRNLSTSLFTNGTMFQLGGATYILLNITNSLIKGEQLFSSDNITGMGIASAFFILGKILQNTHRSYLQMGKKYRIATIKM
jgi:hypothetical protein